MRPKLAGSWRRSKAQHWVNGLKSWLMRPLDIHLLLACSSAGAQKWVQTKCSSSPHVPTTHDP
eukprot:scaffold119606_cov16-Tisochrysis_lutea.AAC.1